MTEPGIVVTTILKAASGVTDLVGQRIYSAPAPQSRAVPFITYTVVDVTPHDTKSGVSTVDEFRVQIDCWADDATEAATINKACRTALDRYTPGLVGGVNLDGIRFEFYRSDYDPDTDLRRSQSDYTIRIKY